MNGLLDTHTFLWAAMSPEKLSHQARTIIARVSSRDQQSDLVSQVRRLTEFVTTRGLRVIKTASEIGSRLNGQRPQ